MVLLLADLVRSIVGLCYKISEEGGAYLSDEDYIESVRYELEARGFFFRQNEVIELEYLGKVVDRHIVEFIIEDKILLDLKGRVLLRHRIFYKQLAFYLLKKNLPLAFVVDFHSHRLKIRKVVNPNFNYQL
ncbi:GxxExxY protein [Patescibacteria group bacterium]|nr:GxxExxY protein [Patescibacteria group bacterium]MCL5798212.1 GxxExxY protein [Patescibacteria group bacterium]